MIAKDFVRRAQGVVATLLADEPFRGHPVGEWNLGDAMDTTIGGLVGHVGIGRKP